MEGMRDASGCRVMLYTNMAAAYKTVSAGGLRELMTALATQVQTECKERYTATLNEYGAEILFCGHEVVENFLITSSTIAR